MRVSLRTSWLPYSDVEILTPHCTETTQVILIQFCKSAYVGGTNKLAKFCSNLLASNRSTHTWIIHFFDISSCLPSCLFSRIPAQAERIEIFLRPMAQKTQFGARKWPRGVFYFDVLGVSLPQTPKNFSTSREISANPKKKSNNV